VISALQQQAPEIVIAVGGAEEAKAPAGTIRLGTDFLSAAQTLAASLASVPAPRPS